MTPRFVTKPAFDAVGWALKTTTDGGANQRDIPRFWDQCHTEGRVAQLEPLVGPLGMLGLCAEFDPSRPGFTYLIGVEARSGVTYPAGVQTLRVPAATYAVVGCVGAMPDAIQKAWGELMGSWLPTSGYVEDGSVNFEVYPFFPMGDERGEPSSPKCYTEIWYPVKKK